MKFLKLTLISAVLLLASSTIANADESYPQSWVHSDPGSIGSDAYSPKTYIQTDDEPASVYYEYGNTELYGKQSPTESVPANTEYFYSPSLQAAVAGGVVFFRLVMTTATHTKFGPAGSMYTRGPVPVNLEPPTVEGLAYPGNTLTCNPGKWNVNTASGTTRWSGTGDWRSDHPASNWQSLLAINLTEDDIGKTIQCAVKVSIVHIGTAEAFSAPVKVVARPMVTAAATPTCQLPSLKGLTLTGAKAKLKRHTCPPPSSVRHEYSRRTKKGRVISARLAADSKVGLVVSKGKKPRKH